MNTGNGQAGASEEQSLNSFDGEDPVEAYKREFKRKRWEREKQEKERWLHYCKKTHKMLRSLSMPILVLAVVLIVDDLLPSSIYSEKAEAGWQKSFGKGRTKTYTSYMRTPSFVLAVPNEIHINYPYYEQSKPYLVIEASALFNIPQRITVTLGESTYYVNVKDTVYYWIPFHWLLLISAAFTLWRKEYSNVAYIASHAPIVILCLAIFRFWQNDGFPF